MPQANPYNDMMKMFTDYKMPAANFNDWFAISRRNFEAAAEVNQVLAEGAQAIAKRSAELMQSAIEEYLTSTRDMLAAGTPEANAAKAADNVKAAVENSINNAREISEIASKSASDAFKVISDQTGKNMEEISQVAKKTASPKKKAA